MSKESILKLSKKLGLDEKRGIEAISKAKLTKALIKQIEDNELTHAEVAEMSGVSRSTITGIVNGSLQKVTIDRLVRILHALGLIVEFRVKKAG